MLGNLKILSGEESFDAYAAFIREVGYPAVPHEGVLWLVRLVLLLAVAVHIAAAFQTWSQSRNARDANYRVREDLSFSYASRTMRWGGVIILSFVVYHLLHFTTGHVHSDFVEGRVYHNFVVGFQNPLVLGTYLGRSRSRSVRISTMVCGAPPRRSEFTIPDMTACVAPPQPQSRCSSSPGS